MNSWHAWPVDIALTASRWRLWWWLAGALAVTTGVLASGLAGWLKAVLLVLTALAVVLSRRYAPRPRRLRLAGGELAVIFSDGVQRPARVQRVPQLFRGVVTLRCGWHRLHIFADQCAPEDFRRLRRLALETGA